jgi:hypothetical protein
LFVAPCFFAYLAPITNRRANRQSARYCRRRKLPLESCALLV